MKRKVIKQANQAHTITLPIEWVRKNKINGKSELEVTESEKSLIITNKEGVEIKKAEIEVKNHNTRSVCRYINALYAKGVDEITIKAEKDISAKILKAFQNTIGYALLSQKGNTFEIKDIGGANYSNLDEIFKRVFQMVLAFYEAAIKDIFGKEEETLESLEARDKEVNKFCLYLQRAINKMSYPDEIKGRTLFTYSFELEKIGDEIQRLWRTNIRKKPKKCEELKKLAEKSFEGLEKAFDFFYQFNHTRSEDLYLLRDNVRKESEKIRIVDKHTVRLIRRIVKIIEDAVDLSHLTLMINLKEN